VIAALLLTLALAAPAKPDPVRDCPVGLVCFTIEEAGAVDVKLIQMERDLKLAKARVKRLGVTAGCGPGAAVELVDGNLSIEPKLFCGLVWGMRW
jgi:hypothetical protein